MKLRSKALGLLGGSLICVGLLAPADAAAGRAFWAVDTLNEVPSRAEFRIMRNSGVGVHRIGFRWQQIEPQRPQSPVVGPEQRSYRWGQTDEAVRRALERGIRPFPVLNTSPGWVTDHHLESPVHTQEGRRGWRDFVTAVIERYGRGGEFFALNPGLPRLPITEVQTWNEQNSSGHYKPGAAPGAYARLVEITHDAVKSVDPKARIVLGGMFGTPGAPRSMSAWRFLNRLYKIGGFKRDYDVVALHPYAGDLRGIRYQFRKIRRVMRRHGQGGRKIYVTEIGWSSAKPRPKPQFDRFVGRRGQAKMVRRSFNLFLDKRRSWRVRRVTWAYWRDPDSPLAHCGYCTKSGLLNKRLRPKPAFRSFKRIVRG